LELLRATSHTTQEGYTMNKDTMRDLLDSQAASFRMLSRMNTETFVETEDDFFNGKSQAYKLAAETFESIIKNYLPQED
jgi:hypothetical protein